MEEEMVETAEEFVPETEEVPEPEEAEQPEPEEQEAEEPEAGQPEQGKKSQPVIPRKAYESEKEKRQALEKKVQELEQKISAPPPAKREPQTIEEHFDVDPARTLGYVDQQIQAARAAYDTDKEQEWKDIKTDLVARGLLNQQTQQTKAGQIASVKSEIYKTIPDFDAKQPELVALAEEYGLTPQEATSIFDPSVVGDTAVRMAKLMNKVHAIVNASRTAKSKEVKQPTKVEAAGNGGFSNKTATVQRQLAKAKESGNLDDWASLLE